MPARLLREKVRKQLFSTIVALGASTVGSGQKVEVVAQTEFMSTGALYQSLRRGVNEDCVGSRLRAHK